MLAWSNLNHRELFNFPSRSILSIVDLLKPLLFAPGPRLYTVTDCQLRASLCRCPPSSIVVLFGCYCCEYSDEECYNKLPSVIFRYYTFTANKFNQGSNQFPVHAFRPPSVHMSRGSKQNNISFNCWLSRGCVLRYGRV